MVMKAISCPSSCIFPWPRPGMKGLSSMDYALEVLPLLYIVQAMSRQGGQFSIFNLHWASSKTLAHTWIMGLLGWYEYIAPYGPNG
jgi:hypothetical protein